MDNAKAKLSEEQLDRISGGHFIHGLHHDWDSFKKAVDRNYKSPETVQAVALVAGAAVETVAAVSAMVVLAT